MLAVVNTEVVYSLSSLRLPVKSGEDLRYGIWDIPQKKSMMPLSASLHGLVPAEWFYKLRL